MPTLEQVLKETQTAWKKVVISNWYGEGKREARNYFHYCSLVSQWPVAFTIRWVLIRDPKGKFKSQDLLCTDLYEEPEQILKWFVMRWQLEVTFHEVRDHLGVETQRQWADWAIARTTPSLLGLFSLVTLLAKTHARKGKLPFGSGLVLQDKADFFGCTGACETRNMATSLFSVIPKTYDVRKMQPELQNYLSNAAFYTP